MSKRSNKKLKPYPIWVCRQCAYKAGAYFPATMVSTYHIGQCGVCGQITSVTEPRDYGYPNFRGFVPSGVKRKQ